MESGRKKREIARKRRAQRVRRRVRRSGNKIRLCVNKSNTNLYVQLIDDVKGETLAAFSTLTKEIQAEKKSRKELANILGEKIAVKAKEKGIDSVVFDRGRWKYHGLIAQIAEGARSGGLQF